MERSFSASTSLVRKIFTNYPNTFGAFCELINNSIQANAKNIWIDIDYVNEDTISPYIINRMVIKDDGNGVQRELLHFLVVQIDDILSMNKQILDYVSANKRFTLSQKFIDYKSHWDAYFNYAENLICDVVKILQSRNYDKSLAYYVLYTAYFYNLIGNGKRSVFFLSQFERYGVDLKNWTVPIQDLYAKIAISKTSKI